MSITELEEPEKWAVRTFGLAELGDLRRTDRLVQLAAALARNPQASLPASLRGETETVGAYRLLNNTALTPEAIQMPHWVQTRHIAATRSQVLMIGDTTEGNFSSHHSLKGAGPVGRGSNAQGLFVHSVLARDARIGRTVGMCVSAQFCAPTCPQTRNQRGEQTARA